MTLSDWFSHHRRSVLFLLSLVALAGVVAAFHLPVSLFPAVMFPRVELNIDSGSRPQHQEELLVTRPVEYAVRSVPGVTQIISTTSRGSTDVSIRFNWGTNVQRALLQVEAAVNQALPELPPGTHFRARQMDPTTFPVIAYSLTSNTLSQVRLRDIARYKLLPLFAAVQGVRRVRVLGGKQAEYQVAIDPGKLQEYGLTLKQVSSDLSQSNVVRAIGRYRTHYQLYLIVSENQLHSISTIRHLIVRAGTDGVVTIGDIAKVSSAVVPQWRSIDANGKRAVLVMVYQQLGGNTVAIDRAIAKQLSEHHRQIPAGVDIQQWYNQSTLITASAGSVRDALALGVLLAVIILLVFLRNIKLTAIALLVVPAVLAATILALYAAGLTFNIMTLGGMAAAVGLIIDDMIVMLEHLGRRLGESGHAPGALLHYGREFTQPLVGSSLATTIIFLPLAFLSGVTGAFFKALSLTMASSLVLSFLFAWVALPLIGDKLMTAKDAAALARSGRVINALKDGYRWLMGHLIRRPIYLFVGLVPLLAFGYLGFHLTASGFMPHMEEGGFVLDYQTPPGTSLRETDRLIGQVAHILATTPDVRNWSRRTGTQLGGGITEPNQGDFFVRLKSPAGQAQVMNSIARRIDHEVPGFRILDMNQPMQDLIGDLTASPRPVVVRIFGSNEASLFKIAPKVADAIRGIRGIREVQDGIVIAGNSLRIEINRTKAGLLGLTPQLITNQLDTYLTGRIVTKVEERQKMVGVRLWVPPRERDSRKRIGSLLLQTETGNRVPLDEVAKLVPVMGQPELTRYDLKPEVAVSARIQGRGYGTTIAAVRRVLDTSGVLPAGVYYQLGGLYRQQQIAFRDLTLVFIAALVLVFFTLLYQYERYKMALAIIVAPLLAIPAVFVGLWITATEINIASIMGMTMIVGIVTELSVFYFSEFRQVSRQLDFRDALVEAGANRLRPILMTTLAFILALIPLAAGMGQGAQMLQPLAIAIVSGLIVQLPLTLVVVPVIYRLLHRVQKRRV